jgi:hypothetical protein
MTMPEIILNLHIHTVHSDGTGTHQDVAEAALDCGIDVVLVSDHNKLVQDQEGYRTRGEKRVLMLIGEEIHDNHTPARNNHLLVFGTGQELAGLAADTQQLVDKTNQLGGLTFIAHPIDPAAPQFNQGDFSWDKWDVTGFTGIELWNGFSEFKTRLKNIPAALWYAHLPKLIARGPIPETLAIWDRLTRAGKQVVAVGGSDAHAMHASLGPIKKTLFPYQFHFKSVNTHLLLPTELTGDFEVDQGLIYQALRAGHNFVGYDLPVPTTGFRFFAEVSETQAIMGDEIPFQEGISLQIKLPHRGECHLIKDGKLLRKWRNQSSCEFDVTAAGIYRVEVFRSHLGRRRGWIYSNPIYIRE